MSGPDRAGRAALRVSRWVAFYTHGLPHDVAAGRQAELESDLYEHAAERRGRGLDDRAIAREISGRAVRGLPADLLWRDSQMRRFRSHRLAMMTVRERRSTRRLTWLIQFVGILASGVGLAASVRAAVNVSIYGNASMGAPIFVAAALAVVAFCLTLRVASRAAGVVLLAVSCALLNWFMLGALANLSARGAALLLRMLAFLPAPVIMFVLLLPTVLVAAALAVTLRKLHWLERHPTP